LSDRPTIEQLDEVRDYFGLPTSSLVEKDWYVVKALAAIASVDTGDLRLVFGGGTALGRAHRLIRRMSEDIDLKIVAEKAPSRPELRELRGKIASALLKAGFEFDPANEEHVKVMHESSFTRYQLPYHALAEGKGILRPQIQIEMRRHEVGTSPPTKRTRSPRQSRRSMASPRMNISQTATLHSLATWSTELHRILRRQSQR
jgi:predicted nucleotidyltransferase component of viral defense system